MRRQNGITLQSKIVNSAALWCGGWWGLASSKATALVKYKSGKFIYSYNMMPTANSQHDNNTHPLYRSGISFSCGFFVSAVDGMLNACVCKAVDKNLFIFINSILHTGHQQHTYFVSIISSAVLHPTCAHKRKIVQTKRCWLLLTYRIRFHVRLAVVIYTDKQFG